MPAKFSFGLFELHVAQMELRKNGVRLRLQEQPFRILTTLLDRPGEIISREELRARLWPEDTYVDFDQSLNKAINRLREMLNDDASRPRYIETVPRRGYKFVAPVTQVTPPEAAALGPPASQPVHRPDRDKRVPAIMLTSVAGCVLLGVAATIALVQRRHTPEQLAAPQLLLSDALAPALSKDGKLLAYVSKVGGDVPHVWVRQTGGGRALQVTSGASRDADPDFSPDGTHIAFSSEGERRGVYVVPALGGDARLVLAGAYWPRFSPDGKRILCIAADKRLRIVTYDDVQPGRVDEISHGFDADGALLWSDIDREFQTEGPPIWSSSGKEIVFLGRRKNQPVTANDWWMVDVPAGAPNPVGIPALKPDHHIHPRIWAWQRTGNGETVILYSVQRADSWTLFRLTVGPGHLAAHPKQVASGPAFLGQVTKFADDGTFVYAVNTPNEQIFEIPVDVRGTKRGPVLELPFTEGAHYFSPSVSRDGQRIAYTQEGIGVHSIVVKDFATGEARVVDEQRQSGFPAVSISADGAKVVFNRRCACSTSVVDCPSYLVASQGGQAEEICPACTPRGFSSDGSFVLMQHYSGGGHDDFITAVDLATKRERKFLKSSTGDLYHAFLSWDDRWVVFKKLVGTMQAQILVAPVRDGQAGDESEWTAVSDGRFADDKPQFSPDGNSVYFTSDRDGYLCIWNQKLDPITKHPVGPALGYEHFHDSMGRDGASYPNYLFLSDLSVARDKILLNLPRGRQDVWRIHLR